MIYGFNSRDDAEGSKVLATRYNQSPAMQGLVAPINLDQPQLAPVGRYHRQGVFTVRVTEAVTAATWDATGGHWNAGTGLVELIGIYSEVDPVPDPPEYRIGPRKYYSHSEGVVTGANLIRRVFNATTDEYDVTPTIDDETEFLHAVEDSWGKLWLVAGGAGGKAIVGKVVNNDIAPQSGGEIELFDKNDIPTGKIANVFNPHEVVFYQENAIPGQEHPADRLIAWKVKGWPEPLVYPFMLTVCNELDPTFQPVEV